MRIAAEVSGEDLQLSWLSASGGRVLVPRRLLIAARTSRRTSHSLSDGFQYAGDGRADSEEGARSF
jgi:hypothetical protein